jgi:hypothetical protein
MADSFPSEVHVGGEEGSSLRMDKSTPWSVQVLSINKNYHGNKDAYFQDQLIDQNISTWYILSFEKLFL